VSCGINQEKLRAGPASQCFLPRGTRITIMHNETLKKLQDIGAFVLASGCTKESIKQVAEMIQAARDYRFIRDLQNREKRVCDYGRNR